MRSHKLIILFLSLFFFMFAMTQCRSAEINCYSGKVRIYHGYGDDFVFDDNFIAFTETKSSSFIMSDADCIVVVRISQGEKFNATTVREGRKN